mgnify:FL=1
MNISRIVVAGVFSFPEGQAASSRILNLTRGFMDHIDDVKVICAFHKDGENEFQSNDVFEYYNKKISYKAIAPHTFGGGSAIKRIKNRLGYYSHISNLIDVIINDLNGNEDEMVFLYGRSYSFLCQLINKINKLNYKSKIIFDVVEPPMVKDSYFEYIKHPFLWESTFVFKKMLPEFYGCTFITHKLQRKFLSKVNRSVIIPSILYQENKTIQNDYNEKKLVIGYLGALITKDYPELLYELCLDLYKKKHEFKLIIIGRFRSFSEGRTWERTFLNSPFKNSIELHFNPNEKTKIDLIKRVNFMTLFRKPEPIQAYTFPTRVVEILGLGKVLIMNDFGDKK